MEEVLKQIDENHPIVIPNWLLIIIRVIGNIVLAIIVVYVLQSYSQGEAFSCLIQREK